MRLTLVLYGYDAIKTQRLTVAEAEARKTNWQAIYGRNVEIKEVRWQ